MASDFQKKKRLTVEKIEKKIDSKALRDMTKQRPRAAEWVLHTYAHQHILFDRSAIYNVDLYLFY